MNGCSKHWKQDCLECNGPVAMCPTCHAFPCSHVVALIAKLEARSAEAVKYWMDDKDRITELSNRLVELEKDNIESCVEWNRKIEKLTLECNKLTQHARMAQELLAFSVIIPDGYLPMVNETIEGIQEAIDAIREKK